MNIECIRLFSPGVSCGQSIELVRGLSCRLSRTYSKLQCTWKMSWILHISSRFHKKVTLTYGTNKNRILLKNDFIWPRNQRFRLEKFFCSSRIREKRRWVGVGVKHGYEHGCTLWPGLRVCVEGWRWRWGVGVVLWGGGLKSKINPAKLPILIHCITNLLAAFGVVE